MDSYGELLKKKRLEKELDINKIAREISIDEKYLAGLEEEDSSVFPGEAYCIGFLKNYADYLELDSAYILKIYNNKKIQESPVPLELLARPKRRFPWFIIPILVVVAVALSIFIVLLVKDKDTVDDSVVISNKITTKQYELSDGKFIARVYKGDQFIIPTEKGQIILTVHDTLSSFALDTPTGTFYVDLAEESEIDVNGDSVADLILYVSDISSTDASRGAEISILLRHGISTVATSVDVDDIPFASEIKSKYPQKVILEDNRAYPFTINANFRGSCLFRDKVDFNQSVETYFTRGEMFTATPRNGIRLWISNANTVKFTIIADSKTFELDIGAAGKILVEDIKWIKDTDGKYKLVVIELD